MEETNWRLGEARLSHARDAGKWGRTGRSFPMAMSSHFVTTEVQANEEAAMCTASMASVTPAVHPS